MSPRCLSAFAVAVLLAACPLRADVSRALLDIQERLYLERDGSRIFADATIYEPSLVDAFYQQAGYKPVWTDANYARQILQLLASSVEEGLEPADYHYHELLALVDAFDQPWSDGDALRAQAEVLLTDGLVLYGKHLIQGKVDPRSLDSSWNYTRWHVDPEGLAKSLVRAIEQRQVEERFEDLKLDTPFYRSMKQQLARYREMAKSEKFSRVPTDRVLRQGDRHPNVLPVRRRLMEMGYLPASDAPDDGFDAAVDKAVRALQRDHALDVDGIVGRQSFRVLNLSAGARVDLLRINMDRSRWISQDMSDEYLVVNIAGYELYYMRDRQLLWQTPVMVGTIETRTPIFRQRLRYLEFNPTWNVPRSLIERKLFVRFSADPGYIEAMGYRFFDANGEVDPSSIDWDAFNGRNLPYRVVQMPGPDNAMGRVKFMFPNRHAVYLHDTPSRELFNRSQRAFSAGCIRVREPLELARLLLDDPGKWSAGQIQALVDSGDPQRVVQIERPVDVLLMYWTVSPESADQLEYHQDIYQLDQASLAALDAPPRAAAFDR